MTKKLFLLVFAACVFVSPVFSKDLPPAGFQELVGKTVLVLHPVHSKKLMGDATNYDEEKGLYYQDKSSSWYSGPTPERQMPKVFDAEETVIISYVEWSKDEAKISIKSPNDKRKAKVTIHFKSPEGFWKAFGMAFDQRAHYSFQLTTGGLQYSDEIVTMSLEPSENGIGIKLKNNLQIPIKVDWSSGSLVDINGEAKGIIHSGVKLINKEDYQKPTTIPPGASITDIIVPSSTVEWIGDGWKYHPLFPLAGKDASSLEGKTISIFLPLQVPGKEDHNLNIPLKVTVVKN